MSTEFDKTLARLAVDSPELQEAIANSIGKDSGGYSIPTRKLCTATGEVEDIHLSYLDIEDEDQRERYAQAIKKIDSLTIGQLAKRLGELRVFLALKEVEGKELTPIDKTLKDIDITTLALFAFLGA